MKTARWEGNEIIKTDDMNGNSVNLMESFDFTTDILGADMIVSGMTVTEAAVPDMTVLIGIGIAKDSTVGTFLYGEALTATIAASDPVSDRYDIIEARRLIEDITPETRQFKNPVTSVITSTSIDTESEYKTELKVRTGTPGSGVALAVEVGWIKIAEILVPSASLTVVNANIYNVDAEKSGDSNTNWTTDTTSIYRNGTVSEMKTKVIDNETAAGLNTTHRSSNGDDHFNVWNSLKGMNHIVLTEYNTTTVPKISIGSQVEINGSIYSGPDVVITGTTVNSTWYDILLTPLGTGYTASFVARGTGVWSDSKQGLYVGNNRVVACVYRDGSGNFINKNVLIVNNRTITIKVEIGAWNMVSTASISIAHGLTYTKIRDISIMILDDTPTSNTCFDSFSVVSTEDLGHSVSASSTLIVIGRDPDGVFDNSSYIDTGANRGWNTIIYEV